MKILATSLLLLAAGAPAAASPGGARPALPAPPTDADFYDDGRPSPEKVELGRLLFYDKLLSGNRNISCATCHHPQHATGDGLTLPFGEGAHGLGPERRPGHTLLEGVFERVPRNSPALFNLGAREFKRMFHDGRVELDEQGFYAGGFITPAKWKLHTGLDNALAAQAMFPPTSPAEMAGQKGENEIADARALNNVAGTGGVWERLADRLSAVPEYVERFTAAFPDEVRGPEDVTFVRAANAIAAFEAVAYRSDDSPFDRWLRGLRELSEDAERGMELFYGKARCSDCHSGKFQTDHDFHAIAMPQVGPGKRDGFDASYWSRTGLKDFLEDFGRGRVTARAEDRYKFRTPSLRNVALTGPWGHAGTYTSLEDVVRHHLDPVAALERYEVANDLLGPLDGALELTASGDRLDRSWMSPARFARFLERDAWVQRQPELRARIARASELAPTALDDGEVRDLVAFLETLTDPSAQGLLDEVPESVPSGLPVAD